MARYKLTNTNWEIYDSERNKYIFTNLNDPDYQEFLAWVQAGNEPDDPQPLPHESPESRVNIKKLVRSIRRIRRWILSQDPNADV